MRLRHIEIFNAVYTLGSVSGAAQFLNITQPTASKILQHAEDQLGFKLFKRVRGRLIPTEEADILYLKTREILEKVISLQKTSRNLLNIDTGRIKLSAISALGLEYIPRAILSFQKKYPDMNFEIQTRHYDNLLPSVLEQNKDVGIAFSPQIQRGLGFITLGKGEFVCIYSGSEFDDFPDRIKISHICNFPIIDIENSGPLGAILSKMILESNISFSSTIAAQTYFTALNLVALGGGVAIVDEFTARSRGVGNVKYKAFDPPMNFSIQAIYKDTNPPSKACLSFLNHFKREILDNRPII